MINEVRLIGNLGQDPEIRQSTYGTIANFSVATTKKWKDKKTREWNEQTEWHRVVAFGFAAESAEKFMHKGDQIYVAGSLQTRKWQDREGNDRYTTEIKAQVLRKLGRKDQSEDSRKQTYSGYQSEDTGNDVQF